MLRLHPSLRRSCERALLATFAVIAIAAPRAAHAQPAPADADVAEGRLHFDRGVLLFDQGDHDGALAEFQRAWELSRRPSVLFNVATTSRMLRRYGDAIEAYRRLRAEATLTASDRQRAERELRELEQLAARVRVTVDPPDAALLVDGRRHPVGVDIVVGPGTHRAEATREDFHPAVEQITIASGETRALHLALRPVRATAAVASARATPGSAGPPTSPTDDGRPSSPARTLAWVAGGAAVAMFGGGAIALAVREGAVERFNDDARCLPDNGMTRSQNCAADEATAGTASTLAWAGFVAGGALAITSAVLFLAAPRERPGATARLRCGVDLANVGAICGGTF
jgi:hypothetical protein